MPRIFLFSGLFILVCLAIVFVPIYFQNLNDKSQKNLGPNYKFIYSLNNLIYLYDLKFDQTQKITTDATELNQAKWSQDGKVAFLDQNDHLQLLGNGDLKPKQFSNDLIKSFFWSKDANRLYFSSIYRNGLNISSQDAQNGFSRINYYFYDLKTQALEPITKREYDLSLSEVSQLANPKEFTNLKKKFLVKNEQQEIKLNNQETINKYYLVFYDLNSKKEVKRMEYAQGAWSSIIP